MLKVATAFSGGLAACEFALRYEDIPHEVVFACEWDKFARKQYESFHGLPTSNFYEDVQNLDAKPYFGKIDLFVFGSPCQDLSLAGNRKGFDGAKSSLFREGARVLEEMKPKAFIFENVKGLLSSNGGADYKEVVKTFQDMGYLIAMKVMNTKDYGVPQNRERVFIVGFLDADAYHSFSFEDGFELETRLKHYLDDSVDEKYYLSNKFVEGSLAHKERHEERGNGFAFEPKSEDDIASCLSTKYGNRQTDTFIKLNQVGTLDIKGNDSIKRVYAVDGLCPTLTTMNGGNREPKILEDDILNPLKGKTEFGWHFEQKVYDINSKCTRALTASEGSGSREKVLQEDYRIRKLTPKECFKLQGVKESCIDLVVSDSQSYKIAGNAISVNVMQSLLRSLYKPVFKKDTLF